PSRSVSAGPCDCAGTGCGGSGTGVPWNSRPVTSVYRNVEVPLRWAPYRPRSMLGLLIGPTSFVVSEESEVHSSNAPSTRGVEGTNPRYPSIRAPGFSRSETTPAPRPNGWTAGRRTPTVSPIVAAKSPRTERVPRPGLTGKAPVSVCSSQETVWTVAMIGMEGETPASHWASVSIRDPLDAAGVAVPLIQPFQSFWFRFESNSHNVLER